jgi:hypothetical protein
MSLKLFVCHIDGEATEFDLRAAFERFGKVASVWLGPSRRTEFAHGGWGFVEMEKEADGRRAAQELEGQPLPGFENGRTQKLLHIEDAKPCEPRSWRRD